MRCLPRMLFATLVGVFLTSELRAEPPAVAQEFRQSVNELKDWRAAEHKRLKKLGATPDQHMAIDDEFLRQARQLEDLRSKALKDLGEAAGTGDIEQGAHGTDPKKGRGGAGDVDTKSMTDAEFKKVKTAAGKKGYKITERGDSFTIEELDTTVHRGESTFKSKPGSSARQSEVGRGYGKETSRSLGSGDKNVKVMDNLGKGGHTMNKPTSKMTYADWQDLGKMTGRNMDAAGIQDPVLRDQCQKLKQGYSPEALGIEDIDQFQQQCRDANKQAAKKTRAAAQRQEIDIENRLDAANKDVETAKKSGNKQKVKKAVEQRQKIRNELSEHRTTQKAAEEAFKSNQPEDARQVLDESKPPDKDATRKKMQADADNKPPSDADGPGKQSKAVADADGPGKAPPDADGPGKAADPDGPSRPDAETSTKPRADPDGPGTAPDADGSGKVADADGPGGKPQVDPDGAGMAPDADGPGRVADVDGPGTAPDVDGPAKPGTAGKALKAVGDYMEGVQIITQADKIRKGVKEGDVNLVAEGAAGEDLAKRAKMEGAKAHAEDMDTFMNAKSEEAIAAAAGKLKRMGASQEEIDAYQQNIGSDPLKARAVVQGVKDRGGVDTKPQKPLDFDQPDQTGWTAKEQLKEGAKQTGDTLSFWANALSGGFTGKGQQALKDSKDMGKQSDVIGDQTKEEVKQAMIKKLAGTGEISVDEAKRLVNQLEQGDRAEFDQVVGDLRKQGAFEKTRGKYGLDPSQRDVDVPEADIEENAKETAETFKEALVDKPADFVTDTVNDLMEISGVGSAKNEAEVYTDAQMRDASEAERKIFSHLIKQGATAGEAQQAINGIRGANAKPLSDLKTKLKVRREKQVQIAKEKEEKLAEQARKEKEQKELERARTARKGLGKEEAEKKLDDMMTDLFGDAVKGQKEKQPADPDSYDEGDTIISPTGVEYVRTPDGWAKTGNEYEPYTPDDEDEDDEGDEEDWQDVADEPSVTEGYVDDHAEEDDDYEQDYQVMDATRKIRRASTSSDKAERDARNILNTGGAEAGRTLSDSARTSAEAQQADSWGKTLADAVQSSVEQGLSRAASTLGSGVADKTAGALFEDKKEKSAPASEGGAAPPQEEAVNVADAQPVAEVPSDDASVDSADEEDRGDKKNAKKKKKTKKKRKKSTKKKTGKKQSSGEDTLTGGSGRDASSSSSAAKVTKPAPKPKPTAPKGKKCACCGGHNTYYSHSHALYGQVYKCRACKCTFHDV